MAYLENKEPTNQPLPPAERKIKVNWGASKSCGAVSEGEREVEREVERNC